MAITAEHREKMAAGTREVAERKRNAKREARDDLRAAIALESETYRRVLKVRESHGAGSPQEVAARRDWTDAWRLMPSLDDLPADNDELWDEP